MGMSTSFFGEIFQLKHGSGGTWTLSVLHTFTGSDGNGPIGGLVMDSQGNLYGTTTGGGNYSGGVVYQLKPATSGTWDYSVIHNFQYDGVTYFDGAQPIASMVIDKGGQLYGTTNFGGNGPCVDNGIGSRYPKGQPPVGCGTVFQLIPGGSGTWIEKILYNFQGGADEALPAAAVLLDHKGNLYGTTSFGGAAGRTIINTLNIGGCGIVFSLIRAANGQYTHNTLYTFQAQNDGANPQSSLLLDRAGNLYGTAPGALQGYGSASAVFSCRRQRPEVGRSRRFSLFRRMARTRASRLWQDLFLTVPETSTAPPTGAPVLGDILVHSPAAKTRRWWSVFKLTPSAGTWTQIVLHSFNGSPDGYTPGYGKLLLRNGALYGVTARGRNGQRGRCLQAVRRCLEYFLEPRFSCYS